MKIGNYVIAFLAGLACSITIPLISSFKKRTKQKRNINLIIERTRSLAKKNPKDAKNFLTKMLPSILELNPSAIPKEFVFLRSYIKQLKNNKDLQFHLEEDKKKTLINVLFIHIKSLK